MSFCNTIALQLLLAPSPRCLLSTVVIFFAFRKIFVIKCLQVLNKGVHFCAAQVNTGVSRHSEHADIFQGKHGIASV